MCVIFLIVSLCVKCFSFSIKAHRLWSLCTLLLTIASQVFFLQFSSAYYEFYSKVNPQNNLFSSAGHRFLCWLRKAPLDWISQLADTWKKKHSENWAPNPVTQDAVFQCLCHTPLFQVLPSLCEIDSQCVENLCPCWHCCADTCWGLWCPWMAEVLPPPVLLTKPISTSCSFVSVCFQSTYLTHSVHGQLCGYNNEMPMPRNFLLAFLWELLIYYWTLSYKSVQLNPKKV